MREIKKRKIKKQEEVCPEGFNPLYCRFCQEARMQQSKDQEKVSRKVHGLTNF